MSTSIVLGVDIGNSRVKAHQLPHGTLPDACLIEQVAACPTRLLDTTGCGSLSEGILSGWKEGMPGRIHLVAVDPSMGETLRREFEDLQVECVYWGPERSIPVEHPYEDQKALGQDRLLGALAATHLAPGEPTVIIDAGTAVTVDLVDAKGAFLGGAIAPGLEVIASALGGRGAQLWQVDPRDASAYPGTDTDACLALGVLEMWAGGIDRLLGRALEVAPDAGVMVTGGDGGTLCDSLKSRTRHIPGLLHIGFSILEHEHAG